MAFYYIKMEVIKYNPFTTITMPNTRSQSNTRFKLNTNTRSIFRSFSRSKPKPKPALTPNKKETRYFLCKMF